MTNRKYTNRSYPDALEKKILVFDGAMGTGLQAQNLTAEQFGGERSTAAIIVYHKDAKYYSVGESRAEQLI